MNRLWQTIVRGFGWRLGAIAAVALVAVLSKFLG